MPEFMHDAEFWVLIAFVIAMAFLIYKTTGMVTGTLDARAAKIKAELDQAQALRDEAQAKLAEYQLKQRDALKEAEGIVAHAKAETIGRTDVDGPARLTARRSRWEKTG